MVINNVNHFADLNLGVEILFGKEGQRNKGVLVLNEGTEARATHLHWGLKKISWGEVCFFINVLVSNKKLLKLS